MLGRMVSFAACAFVGFAVALRGWVMFTAFSAYFVEAFVCRSVMSELLAFVALDQLKLEGIFIRIESLMVNVESMFDTLVG